MIIIDSFAAMARALEQSLDPDLKRLLALRRGQLADDPDAARFIIVEPDDNLTDVEAAIGFPLVLDDAPTWEWAERHGGFIEVAFIFGDAAEVLLVPERDGTDPALIALLHLHAAADLYHQQATAP